MDFDAPDIDARREDLSRPDTARKGARVWLILILIVFLLLALVVALSNAGVSTITKTEPAGQCNFTTKTFNARQEAFTLAQSVEQYRSTKPANTNYGMGSYTICYKDSTQQRFPSPVAPGYSQTVMPTNATHSEQAIYQWLLNLTLYNFGKRTRHESLMR